MSRDETQLMPSNLKKKKKKKKNKAIEKEQNIPKTLEEKTKPPSKDHLDPVSSKTSLVNYEQTFLLSVATNQLENIRSLLERKLCDPDTTDEFGDSALCIAVSNGNLGTVQLLAKLGADVNFKGALGYTPLMYAIQLYEIEIVKLLLATGKIKLLTKNDYEIIDIVLALETYFNIPADDPEQTNNKKKSREIYHLLVEAYKKMALAGQKDNASKILLELIVDDDYQEEFFKLLQDGILNINVCDEDNRSLLRYALEFNEEIVPALLNRGADPSIPAKDGSTALDDAIKKENLSLVLLLYARQHGQQNFSLKQAIVYSIKEKNFKLFKFFIESDEFVAEEVTEAKINWLSYTLAEDFAQGFLELFKNPILRKAYLEKLISTGAIAILETLKQLGVHLNKIEINLEELLRLALVHNQIPAFKYLLEMIDFSQKKLILNLIDFTIDRNLLPACLSLMEKLHNKPLNLASALLVAVNSANLKLINFYIQRGATITTAVLLAAIKTKKKEVVDLVFSARAQAIVPCVVDAGIILELLTSKKHDILNSILKKYISLEDVLLILLGASKHLGHVKYLAAKFSPNELIQFSKRLIDASQADSFILILNTDLIDIFSVEEKEEKSILNYCLNKANIKLLQTFLQKYSAKKSEILYAILNSDNKDIIDSFKKEINEVLPLHGFFWLEKACLSQNNNLLNNLLNLEIDLKEFVKKLIHEEKFFILDKFLQIPHARIPKGQDLLLDSVKEKNVNLFNFLLEKDIDITDEILENVFEKFNFKILMILKERKPAALNSYLLRQGIRWLIHFQQQGQIEKIKKFYTLISDVKQFFSHLLDGEQFALAEIMLQQKYINLQQDDEKECFYIDSVLKKKNVKQLPFLFKNGAIFSERHISLTLNWDNDEFEILIALLPGSFLKHYGEKWLLSAAVNGEIEKVRIIAKQGFNLAKMLHLAIIESTHKAVFTLVQAGAKDPRDRSLLTLAVKYNAILLFHALLKSGEVLNATLILNIVKNSRWEIFQQIMFFQQDEKSSFSKNITSELKKNATALMNSVADNESGVRIATELLKYDIDVFSCAGNELLPWKVFDLILKNLGSYQINQIVNQEHRYLLTHAIQCGASVRVQQLIEHNALISYLDLVLAVNNKNLFIVDLILSKKPIFINALQNDSKLIVTLASAELGQVNLLFNKYKFPINKLFLQAVKASHSITELNYFFLHSQFDVNYQEEKEETAVSYAIDYQKFDLLEKLVEFNPIISLSMFTKAVHLALQKNTAIIVAILLQSKHPLLFSELRKPESIHLILLIASKQTTGFSVVKKALLHLLVQAGAPIELAIAKIKSERKNFFYNMKLLYGIVGEFQPISRGAPNFGPTLWHPRVAYPTSSRSAEHRVIDATDAPMRFIKITTSE